MICFYGILRDAFVDSTTIHVTRHLTWFSLSPSLPPLSLPRSNILLRSDIGFLLQVVRLCGRSVVDQSVTKKSSSCFVVLQW